MLIFKVTLSFKLLLFPVYLLQLFIFVLGTSFLLSALYVKYRDMIYIWSFVLLIGFFATPIIYPIYIIPFEYLKYYLLNPLARMIVDMRDIVLFNYIPDPKNFIITFMISLLVFVFGYYIFRKNKHSFVEEI